MLNPDNPRTAGSYEASMFRAEQSWHNRFGEASTHTEESQQSQRRDINAVINERAAQKAESEKNAQKGSGEGFWSRDARDERTTQHRMNFTANYGPTRAYDAVKSGFGIDDPYKPSALHRRRAERNGYTHTAEMPIEPMKGSEQLPGDRPQA